MVDHHIHISLTSRESEPPRCGYETVELLNNAARAKRLRLAVAIDEGAWAMTDSDLIGIMLQNLIGNAIKHEPHFNGDREEKTVEIRAEFSPDGGLLKRDDLDTSMTSAWTISISDHALGMSAPQSMHSLMW